MPYTLYFCCRQTR